MTVTAQRRETDLQTTPVAISAYGGEPLVENKIFTVNDLAKNVPAFSLTALTPLDAELNIRGITNTRLDSPTADPSVGTFVDGVYMGRTGDLNYDFYDLERIEVIRGPQGVLLGKNVVGGALSVITAKPTFEPSGNVLVSYGNYNSMLVSGLRERRAQRLVGGARLVPGTQARRLCRGRPASSATWRTWSRTRRGCNCCMARTARHSAAASRSTTTTTRPTVSTRLRSPAARRSCETSYLRTNCTRPWSNLRAYLGLTDPRKNVAQSMQFAGEPRIQQFMERDGFGAMLDLEYEATGFTFNSLTGYRMAKASSCTTRPAPGPRRSAGTRRSGRRTSPSSTPTYGTRPATSNNGQFLFAQPVGEDAEVQQFSQEFRLTSNDPGQPLRLDRGHLREERRHQEDRPLHR